MATNVSSTTLAEIDIVFVWFDIYKPDTDISEMKCDFIFDNKMSDEDVETFIKGKYEIQCQIRIDKIER